MAEEVKQIQGSVGVSVTIVNTVPIDLKVVGDTVYVYPPNNVEVGVSAGSLWSDGVELVAWPGAVIEFNNELVKPIGMDGSHVYQIIFAKSTKEVMYHEPTAVTFIVDSTAGTVRSNVPCYAVLVFDPKEVYYSKYVYTSPFILFKKSSSSSTGTQLSPAVAETFQAVVYAIYRPQGWPQVKADIKTDKIQMPIDAGVYEFSSVEIQTVTTATGEWQKPKDWDSDTYNMNNAYGQGVKGPDKDEPWVATSRPIMKSMINSLGNLNHTTYATPNLKGSDTVPLKDAPKVMYQSKVPEKWATTITENPKKVKELDSTAAVIQTRLGVTEVKPYAHVPEKKPDPAA